MQASDTEASCYRGLFKNSHAAILISALTLALMLALASGFYLLHAQLHQQTRTATIETLHAVAALKSDEIEHWLQDRLIFFSQPPGGFVATQFAQLLQSRSPDAAIQRLEARLQYLQATLPELKSIRLYDRNHQLQLGNPEAHEHFRHVDHRAVAQEAMATRQARFISIHKMSEVAGDVALEIVTPLIADATAISAPIGYALIEIDPGQRLFPLLQSWPVPSTSAETVLVQREGDELVFIHTLNQRGGPHLLLRKPLATQNLISAQAYLTGQETIEGDDYRGIPALAVVLKVAGTDWLLIAKMDNDEIYTRTHRILLWAGTGVAVLLAVLLLLGRTLLARQRAEAHIAVLAQDKLRLEALARTEADLAENEERLRALGDNLPDSYVYQSTRTRDGQARFLYLSDGIERINGISATAALADASLLYQQIVPEDIPSLIAAEQESFTHMTDFACEFRIRHPDGSLRWLHARSRPLRHADGQLIWNGVTTDITARKHAEALSLLQARRAEALLKLPALGEQLDEMTLMQQGQEFAEDLTSSTIAFIHFVNTDEETIELVAWSSRTLAHYCTAAFDQHYPVAEAGIWADALRQRRAVVINDYTTAAGKHGLPAGHAELIRLISVPVIEQGKVVMLTGVGNKASAYTELDVETVQLLSDAVWRIVQRQRAERAIRHALETERSLNQKLEEAHNQLLQSEKMASIGQLAAGVAHELNNPIGFVNSNLGSLDSYLKDIFAIIAAYETVELANSTACPELLDAVRTLKREKDFEFLKSDIVQLMAESKDGLARVAKIVKDLKDFSRAGEATYQWANLEQGLDSTLNIVWNELKYKCTVTKEYGNMPAIWCVPAQLNQVFMNLLVNAAHAIPEKGDITIHTGQQGDEVFVAISDNGSGIAPENLTRIFDPFFTTKPVGKGTGLGLSLAYSIVQKHQGRFEVQSKVGQGTTFTVWLPLNPIDQSNSTQLAVPAAPTIA